MITLRLFDGSDADYEALADVHNAVFPEYIEQPEDVRHWDEQRPAHCKLERWFAEDDGSVVGTGTFLQAPWMYHPHKFHVYVDVLPACQGRGLGRHIYGHLLERLAPHQPVTLRTDTREDLVHTVGFLERRGFIEEMRVWESRLDVQAFDASPWAGHDAKVLAKGCTIVTLRELLDGGESFKPALYEAISEMARDVPQPEEFTPLPFEHWVKMHFTDPNLLPEGYYIAMHEGNLAGVSQLWLNSGYAHVLNTGLTATRRDFRRMGIALALKLRAIAFAKERGIAEIRTGNESNNRAMLSINEALGFVKQPAWVNFVKELQ